jgi:vWA domain found in the FtsH ternary systems/N-terminal helical region fused to the FtsH ternary system vWA domain
VKAPVRELRTQADVASWLAAGLALRRVITEDDDALIAQAIGACANELPALPPPGMIADVAVLLGGARLPLSGPVATNEEGLRAAIRAYDDDVLARLVTNARFDDVLAAYAHLQPGDRATATALVVGAICERAGFAGSSVSPAALRRALARPKDEREAAGRTELLGGPIAQRLADSYDRLSRSARQSRSLVDQHEVFALDHMNVLRDLGARLTADHISAAAEALERTLPRRLPANRQNRGMRDTHLADESLYPAGGFTSITPGGSNANIENLVTSELVYMEDGPETDVFTLRYVEGELLYYTRDDSVFRRHRQVIGIALGADLDDARVKDRDLPWQRLILALGLLVAAIRWLTEQLGDHALTIRIAFPPNMLSEEREIVTLLLGGEVHRGTVVIEETSWQDLVDATAAAGSSAISDVIVMSMGPIPTIPKGLRALHVNLHGAAPTAAAVGTTPAEPSPDSWREWCEVAEDLLRWLV